jgi:hypothetical protein
MIYQAQETYRQVSQSGFHRGMQGEPVLLQSLCGYPSEKLSNHLPATTDPSEHKSMTNEAPKQ